MKLLLRRWCWQRPDSFHALHWLLMRWCWHRLAHPPALIAPAPLALVRADTVRLLLLCGAPRRVGPFTHLPLAGAGRLTLSSLSLARALSLACALSLSLSLLRSRARSLSLLLALPPSLPLSLSPSLPPSSLPPSLCTTIVYQVYKVHVPMRALPARVHERQVSSVDWTALRFEV